MDEKLIYSLNLRVWLKLISKLTTLSAIRPYWFGMLQQQPIPQESGIQMSPEDIANGWRLHTNSYSYKAVVLYKR